MKLYENKEKCNVKIATSLEELAMMGVISFNNRPNPRKRRGRRNMINEASTRSSMPNLNRNVDYHNRPSNIDEHEKSSKIEVVRGTQSLNIGCNIDNNVKASLEGTQVKQFSADPSKSYADVICGHSTTARTEKNPRGNTKLRHAKSKYRDDNGVRKRKRF